MTDAQVTRDRLMQDFNEVVGDTEKLLKSLQSASGEKAEALRATIEQNVATARERLERLEAAAGERARATAAQADEYVRVHPWESLAIGAGIAAVIGVVVGLLLGRR